MPVNATGPGARRRFCAEFGPDEAPGEGLCDPGDAPCDPGDAIFAGQKGPSGVLQDLGLRTRSRMELSYYAPAPPGGTFSAKSGGPGGAKR